MPHSYFYSPMFFLNIIGIADHCRDLAKRIWPPDAVSLTANPVYFWIKLIYRIREAYHNHKEGLVWLR